MHDKITSEYSSSDELPCADATLLIPLKKSSDYRLIRPRIASPKAIDSWQEDGLHFFVFALQGVLGMAEPPVAVFTMHPEEPAPLSVVVVTPSPDGEEAEVLDLRQPDSAYTAPLAGNGPAQHQNGASSGTHVPDAPGDALRLAPTSAEPLQPTALAPVAPVPETDADPTVLNEPALTSSTTPQDPVGEATGEIPNAPGIEPALAETVSRPEATVAQNPGSEGQPCGDLALLAPLKKSPEYRVIRRRGAKPRAIDSWQEDGLHFFVFELRAAEGAAEPPMAVFTMHPAEAAPVSVVVVTPRPDGAEAEILNMRAPDSAYSAPLPP